MKTREEFGSYLLLKKLAEDPLGETFRAGKLGSQGMEQVVLLRAFNGEAVDRQTLWQGLEGRQGAQAALKSPSVGTGVDLGLVRGVPYIAYDYISGINLASLMRQSLAESSPIPADHALLITDRAALGLAVGWETRLGDERLLHGFLVPHLVMLSNEGEIRVLGFEAAPGLRQAAAQAAPEISRFLSPEIRAGQPVDKSDDVYSLGAILFELLTGKALPADPAAVDGAVVAAEGTPMPPALASLIKRSAGPRGQRLSDVVAWHKELAKLMAEGQYNPTTFNLAFFMHNLFKEEIERENREIEAERTMVMSSSDGASTQEMPVVAAGAGTVAEEPEAESTGVIRERYGIDDDEKKKGKGMMIGLAAAALLVVVAGVVYFLFLREPAEPAPPPPEPAVTEPVATDPLLPETGAEGDALADGEGLDAAAGEEGAEPAAAAGPTPEELQEQIDAMFAERAAALEESIRAQYDERLSELRQELDSAQAAEAQEEAAPDEAEKVADAEPAAAQPAGAGEVATPPAAGGESQAAAGAGGPATPPAGGQAAPGGEAAAGGGAAAKPAAPPPEPAAEPITIKPPPEPKPRLGDLVEPGPGVVPPKLDRLPDPRYPPLAKRLNKQATVTVRVLVDENGRVSRAEREGEKVGFGFDEAAITAARNARFQPATKQGVRVKMWTTLNIQFKP